MNAAPGRFRRLTGLVLHVLLGALFILAGGIKLLNPGMMKEQLAKDHLAGEVTLLGAGELITAILLIVPVTSSLGVLLMSGLWGGIIVVHMIHGQNYLVPSAALLLTWVGAYLREPAMFSSFSRLHASTERPIT